MKTFKKYLNEVAKPTGDLKKACWTGYTAVGTKKKNGRTVPNCVPEEVELEETKMTDLQKKAAKYDFTKTKSGREVPKQKKPFRMGNEPIVKNEDVMDPQAAIAKVPDTDPSISERTRQLSKSARMIKALYKSKRMVKEDLYDHEKEDKSVATYGKKPKFDKADEKDSAGENKPAAAATMTGGTTLTGEKRDDIEIDPMMRLRPGQPDPFKKDDKKKDDKKDGKKEEKK